MVSSRLPALSSIVTRKSGARSEHVGILYVDAGELGTHAPSTYKIPTCSDLAPDFRVTMLESASNREDTIYRSKAVGEPPFMLGLSVFHAIRDAIATDTNPMPVLNAPATPEAVLAAWEGT